MADLTLPTARRVLEAGVASRIFPGAVLEIGRRDAALVTIAHGALTYAAGAPRTGASTIYDLASLTKVLATTALTLDAVQSGRLRLNDRVHRWIPAWTGPDRQGVTIQHLLEHCSGLPSHRQYDDTGHGRAAYELRICAEPLGYAPRTQSVYSDLGFMLLGFVLENALEAPLDRLFDDWRDREIGSGAELRFQPPAAWLERIAPTEDSELGEELRGSVHDENARALDGVAAHAGLFGTAAAVGACARWWLSRVLDLPRVADSPLATFIQQSTVPGSSRALGWDTMLTASSCGTRLTRRAIGHTGFTGTSLWIDPGQDLYVAFLSNRVHPTRLGEGIQKVRRDLHDAVVADLTA